MQQSHNKKRICAGLNEMMLSGHFGCFGATWVEHNQLSASRFEIFNTLLDIRYGPDAAVRGQRVSAQH